MGHSPSVQRASALRSTDAEASQGSDIPGGMYKYQESYLTLDQAKLSECLGSGYDSQRTPSTVSPDDTGCQDSLADSEDDIEGESVMWQQTSNGSESDMFDCNKGDRSRQCTKSTVAPSPSDGPSDNDEETSDEDDDEVQGYPSQSSSIQARRPSSIECNRDLSRFSQAKLVAQKTQEELEVQSPGLRKRPKSLSMGGLPTIASGTNLCAMANEIDGSFNDSDDDDLSSRETFDMQDMGSFSRQISKLSTSDFARQISQRSSCYDQGFSSVSNSHIERWSDVDETLILFDFDDTLCPTSHLMEHPECRAGVDQDLEKHEAVVSRVLEMATSLGQVQIVTMATDAWVEEKLTDLMPGVRDKIQELNIPIVCARANLNSRQLRAARSDRRDPSHFLKAQAMKRVIRKFYHGNKHGGRSWKNILSIGDSEAERLALQDIVFHRCQRDRKGGWKECLCKTLLLLNSPKLVELTAQLKFVEHLLPALVQHDGDVHMDIDKEDLEAAMAPVNVA